MLPPSPFTRDEARAAGISRYDWELLREGHFVRQVIFGVYVDAALPDSLDLRIAAVAKKLPPDVVVSRRTSAWACGVDVLDPHGHPIVPRVETTTRERMRRPKHRLAHSHAGDDLLDSDIVERGGILLTSPVRTACDLGRFLPRGQALAAIDALLHAGLVTKDELWAEVHRYRRRRGVRQLEEMISLAEPACESGGESRLRLRIVDAGFPRPQVQLSVCDATGRERYRIDLGYEALLIGLEYDGEAYHGPEQAEHDRERREWLADHKWLIAAFRRLDVFGPGRVVEDKVAELLALRPSR